MSANQLVKTYYDVSRFVLWGDNEPEGDTKRSRLVFGFRDGNPRITVYTGISGPGGVIAFPSDYPTMVGIINILKDVVKAAPGAKFSIDSLTSVYENNKPTTEKKVVSSLYIGKSKEGLVYFSVISEGKPKLLFTIKASPFHAFRDSDKNIVSADVVSCKIANGIADLILNIISSVIVNYTSEEYTGDRKPVPIKGNQNAPAPAPLNMGQDLDDLNL